MSPLQVPMGRGGAAGKALAVGAANALGRCRRRPRAAGMVIGVGARGRAGNRSAAKAFHSPGLSGARAEPAMLQSALLRDHVDALKRLSGVSREPVVAAK